MIRQSSIFLNMLYYTKIVHRKKRNRPLCLCVKTSLRAKPFIWKCVSTAGSFSCKPNSFSYEKFCTKTRFEAGAQGNSEIAYWMTERLMNGHIYLIQEYISIINAVGRAHVSHHLLHWPRDRVGGKVRWPAIHAAWKWRVSTDIDTERLWAYGSMPHGGVGCLWCRGGVRRVSWCRMRVVT